MLIALIGIGSVFTLMIVFGLLGLLMEMLDKSEVQKKSAPRGRAHD